MNAREIMSSPVVSIDPDTAVVQIAATLRRHRISGVPVLKGDALVGIVTEKDLLHRCEIHTEHTTATWAWWRRVIGQRLEPDWYVKSHGRLAAHVMTTRVVVASPASTLREISCLFDAHRIGRVPIVEGNRVVGIVTCADLVRALASHPAAEPPSPHVDDQKILGALLAELGAQSWWSDNYANVDVVDGVVCFRGLVRSEAQRRASHVAAENMRGVRFVKDDRQLVSEVPSML
jgi:CBS domain-containing protein